MQENSMVTDATDIYECLYFYEDVPEMPENKEAENERN